MSFRFILSCETHSGTQCQLMFVLLNQKFTKTQLKILSGGGQVKDEQKEFMLKSEGSKEWI